MHIWIPSLCIETREGYHRSRLLIDRLCQRYHKFYLVWCGSSHWRFVISLVYLHISLHISTLSHCANTRLVPIDLSVLLDSTDTNLVIIWSIGLPLAFLIFHNSEDSRSSIGNGVVPSNYKRKLVIVWGQKGCLSIHCWSPTHQCPKS